MPPPREIADDDHASVFIVRPSILVAGLPDDLDDFTLREYVLLAMHKAKPESKRKKDLEQVLHLPDEHEAVQDEPGPSRRSYHGTRFGFMSCAL